jgi:DNA-binding transcriptional LysR family regulator
MALTFIRVLVLIDARSMDDPSHHICKNADMRWDKVSSEDLRILLAVGRTGRFTTAADVTGLNHTTVSRRIEQLEKALAGRVLARGTGGWELTDLGRRAFAAAERIEAALHDLDDTGQGEPALSGVVRLSATDGFSALLAAPAAVDVRSRHPGVSVEIVTATRVASHTRTGLDIEIVVGEPHVHRAEALRLADYRLGLYASRQYAADHVMPESPKELTAHPLVYFVDSMLAVDDLDLARTLVPQMAEGVTSTNVFVHVEATRAHAGIGLLPCYLADRHDDLIRVLPDVNAQLTYWLVARAESFRRPAVAAVIDAIRRVVEGHRSALLGAASPRE